MFVVTGVTGNTGSVVADALIARGQSVRVVVRDAAKGAPWAAKGAEVAVASLDDREALARAFAGARGAYVLLPPDVTAPDFLALRRGTIEAIASAVDDAKVPHVVLLSSVGAHLAAGTGPIRSVHAAEERLAKTGASLTAVRAAYFMENWAGSFGALAAGKLPSFFPKDLAFPMVATRDIGQVAAAALVEGPHGKRQVIELSGPREYAAEDVARAASAVLSKPVTVDEAPLAAVVPAFVSFGFSPGMAELYREMIEGVIVGRVTWEGAGAKAIRGTVTLDEVVKAALKA